MQFTVDCFYGLGVGYRGNVNITRSGRTCQTWNSQCPHRHWRIPQDVTDGQNDSNMCRNPDSSAPDGPWCYTTDPQVRWEYCNVTKCPPRGILNSLSNKVLISNILAQCTCCFKLISMFCSFDLVNKRYRPRILPCADSLQNLTVTM